MVFDHNWGMGGQPEPHPYCKMPLKKEEEKKEQIRTNVHLQLYPICSCTSIKVTLIHLKHYLVEIEGLTRWYHYIP